MLKEKKVGKGPGKSILQEESLRSLSMESGIISNREEKPVPWFITRSKEEKSFVDHYKAKDKHIVVEDMFLPAMWNVNEIIHNADTPPQTRLQASQLIISKVIGDKIEITQQKQVIDINKLLDQLSAIKQVSRDIPQNDVSPIIDITPISNDIDKL